MDIVSGVFLFGASFAFTYLSILMAEYWLRFFNNESICRSNKKIVDAIAEYEQSHSKHKNHVLSILYAIKFFPDLQWIFRVDGEEYNYVRGVGLVPREQI